MLVRMTGLIQLLLGVLFWTGSATGLIPAHVVIGFLFVLGLWGLALAARRAGLSAMAAFTGAWGALVAVLGSAQTRLVPGAAHWTVQALHLALGVMAVGLGETLAGRLRRA
jgi:hypothetical protein